MRNESNTKKSQEPSLTPAANLLWTTTKADGESVPTLGFAMDERVGIHTYNDYLIRTSPLNDRAKIWPISFF